MTHSALMITLCQITTGFGAAPISRAQMTRAFWTRHLVYTRKMAERTIASERIDRDDINHRVTFIEANSIILV